MSNYFTQFSCQLDVGSRENAERALVIAADMQAELDREQQISLGFEVSIEPDEGGVLWIQDGDGCGDPEHVIGFVLHCAEVFDLKGRWGFVWGLTCSRPLLDGFGGGAQVLDLTARRSIAWTDCSTWLGALLDPATDPDVGVVLA